jgi:hypothetical protein
MTYLEVKTFEDRTPILCNPLFITMIIDWRKKESPGNSKIVMGLRIEYVFETIEYLKDALEKLK